MQKTLEQIGPWGHMRRIYRCDGMVQAGTSVLDIPTDWLRSDILNPFFNPSYILSGHGWYIDAMGRRFRYGSGMLLIRFPGVLHHQLHEAGSTYVDKFFALPATFGAILLEQGLLNTEQPLIELGMRPGIVEQFDALSAELERCREDQLMPVMADYFAFFCRVLNSISCRQPHYGAIMAGAEMLERHLEKTLSAAEVAERVGMTYPNFRRLFTFYLKIPPTEYRIRKRIEMIRRLLVASELSLKEIASHFGYADIYTFARQFKHYAGIPPGEFRRREFCGFAETDKH